ncbi:CBO0543 family protein [Alkalihalophilus lindianensis]|uniref:CBO0543 family protein n=1 Tax=Alkalihalophilus lindianensis TaxID=1630542 RepID=A0ABU3XDU2_9BACI|nr:CBO0543 family protein [Alkalihalophilus lindianensis]MDV2686056.1 CBO0543 family protein [Alkalihalophilus lindianensis]
MRMNTFLFFIIPWLIATIFFRGQKRLFRGLFPFSSLLSTSVCLWGDYHRYWVFKPNLKKFQVMTTMPLTLGLYPVLSTLMVYLIKQTKESASSWILTFTCLTTILEFLMKLFGRATYGNGWTLNKTFISYLIPYYLVHKYSQFFLK